MAYEPPIMTKAQANIRDAPKEEEWIITFAMDHTKKFRYVNLR